MISGGFVRQGKAVKSRFENQRNALIKKVVGAKSMGEKFGERNVIVRFGTGFD